MAGEKVAPTEASAVVIRRPGSWDRLRVEAVPRRPMGSGEVRVAVDAAGVNFADVLVRMGLYEAAKRLVGWPITPGFEVAGTVIGVGSDVPGIEPGQPVVAACLFGGYATEVVARAEHVFPRPAFLDAPRGAGVIVVGMTAWYALTELARPPAGSTVLVHSAAGGVGSLLVQMAKLADVRTIGVVGASHKIDHARQLGCDVVVDKSREDLWNVVDRVAPDGLSAVFDPNGAETMKQGYDRLAPAGRLVVYGAHAMFRRGGGSPSYPKLVYHLLRTPRFDPLRMATDNKGVLGFNLTGLMHRQDLFARAMDQIFGWLESGAVRLPEYTSFPLSDVAQAHQALESGQTVGKLILEVDDPRPTVARPKA